MEIKKALKILGLNSREANLPNLEKAYRKLAVKYHPDRCDDKRKKICREKFIEVNNAREMLEKYLIGGYRPEYRVSKAAVKRYREHIREYQEHIEQFYKGFVI